ncbi:MAG: EAL domain-containing protein [Gammaproteobacteria bacterium]|nr:EAL domain-containing protein [Gammaproteobacteria bacterium]
MSSLRADTLASANGSVAMRAPHLAADARDKAGAEAAPAAARIGAEQVSLLYQQAPLGLTVNLFIGVLAVWLLWTEIPHALLLTWFTVIVVVTLLRGGLVCRYRQVRPAPEEAVQWRICFVVGVAMSGFGWGTAGWLFPPYGELDTQVIIVFFLGGMVAGAIPMLACVLRAYLLYLGTTMLPVVVWFHVQWDPIHLAMGVMITIYCAALLLTARHYNDTIMRSLSLAFENGDLINNLKRTNESLEASNRKLEAEKEDRAHAELALRQSEERSRTLLENAPVCIHEMGVDGRLQAINPAGLEMLGIVNERDVRGRSYLDLVHPEDRERVCSLLARAAVGHPCAFEFTASQDDIKRVFACSLIPLRGAGNNVQRIVGVTQDITDAHHLSQLLSYHASHDTLTGLVNRREFESRLQKALESARRNQSEHALCYLDLDQFKIINDTCGHVAGDALLRQLGLVLQEHTRKCDLIARLGGDEFGVLMEDCTPEHARRLAQKMRDAVNGFRFFWQESSFGIGVSIGLVPITGATEGMTALLSAADAACYAAKDQGRNRIHVYHEHDAELVRRHGEMQWVARIQHALEENRFHLALQSIVPVDPTRREGAHYELLLRMEDDDGQPIQPGEFLPAAERYSLIGRLDRWVVRAAFDWLARHARNLPDLHLCCINLSGQSIDDPGFLDYVVCQLDETGVPADKICFEITETAAIAQLSGAMRFMTALRGRGCRFALDDFGSGLSSFAYLKNLPVDFLKIDGAFVKGIDTDPMDLAIVRAIHELARVMDKQTVAECVYDEAALEKLREIGIDYAQGHAFGELRRADELASY